MGVWRRGCSGRPRELLQERRAVGAPTAARRSVRLRPQAGARGDHRGSAVVDRVDDLTCIDSLQVDRGDPEVGMPELPLDNRQRDAFVRHLDRMRVAELMRCEPPSDPGLGS